MRITNKMTADLLTKELFRNKQLLLEAQVRVTTGKRINKPSDDPIGMGKVLNYRKIISQIEQYDENIAHGKNQIEFTETILEQVDTLLSEAEGWANKFAGGYNADQQATALIQVQAIYDEIMNLANTNIGDNFLFAGHVTNTTPFSRDASYNPTYAGDDGDIHIMVADNVQIKINATGQDVFDVGGTGGGTDVFVAVQDLINALQDPDPVASKAAAEAAAIDIRSAIVQVQNVATQMSVNYGRLESSENFLAKYKSNIEDSLQKTENVDPAQAIVEMQLQETAYVSNLETASKIIQPSLLNFLK